MTQQRFVILTFVVGAILVGLVAQSAVESALLQASLTDDLVLGLMKSSSLAAILVGFGTFFGLLRNKKAVRFTDEVIAELAKVTWPTREEAVRASTTVIFTTVLVALLLGVYDLLWKNLADLFLYTEG